MSTLGELCNRMGIYSSLLCRGLLQVARDLSLGFPLRGARDLVSVMLGLEFFVGLFDRSGGVFCFLHDGRRAELAVGVDIFVVDLEQHCRFSC